MKKTLLLVVLAISFFPLVAQPNILDSIRNATSDSLIMEDVSCLSDVYGPRLIGTPNYYNSILYLRDKLENLGIKTRLESFDRGYRGWDFSDFSMKMVEPNYSPISAYPLAFSSSTEGEKKGHLIFINSLKEAYELEGKLKDKIIMLEALYHPVRSVESPMSRRLSDEILTMAAANPDPNDVLIGYHSRHSIPSLFNQRKNHKLRMARFFEFLKEEGAIAVIEPSDYPYGILHADGNRSVPSFKLISDIKPIASFVIANEDFGRLIRLHKKGFDPKLSLSLTSNYYQNPKFNQNLIAEIEGSDPDLKDEVVIIGAHLDSWHAGTGAVDNASNVSVLVEVMRVLKEIKAATKRTVRLILWGGEEHVFAGSEFYVDTNVGDMKTGAPKKEHPFISAYFNLDNGAGKIRGIYLMGNKEIEPYFSAYLQPFETSNTLTIQNANQTDHWLFDYQNIPAFQFIQDPLDYISAIHHTNIDKFEYVPKKDQKYNAELIAYLVHQIGNEKYLMPRKKYNFISPNKTGNTTFSLTGFKDAKEVSVVGDFNNWDMFNIPMYKTEAGWETKINLPKGKYFYKFIVDEYWTNNPDTPENELTKDGKGHAGLTVIYVD